MDFWYNPQITEALQVAAGYAVSKATSTIQKKSTPVDNWKLNSTNFFNA